MFQQPLSLFICDFDRCPFHRNFNLVIRLIYLVSGDVHGRNCTQVLRPIKDIIISYLSLVQLHFQHLFCLTGKSLPPLVKEAMLNPQDALYYKIFKLDQQIINIPPLTLLRQKIFSLYLTNLRQVPSRQSSISSALAPCQVPTISCSRSFLSFQASKGLEETLAYLIEFLMTGTSVLRILFDSSVLSSTYSPVSSFTLTNEGLRCCKLSIFYSESRLKPAV